MRASKLILTVRDYDLAATLDSGQAFRWTRSDNAWHGVIGNRWIQLEPGESQIVALTASPQTDWTWLTHYLQSHLNLAETIATFPDDDALRSAVSACRGLRLLRQDPWECLASFILSSTKQILQIRQIVATLCERFGERIPVREGHAPAYRFPTAARLAKTTEAELRACKMGFRAPNLLATARAVAEGRLNLDAVGRMPLDQARETLMTLPGVGRKIADCVLLFAYGFQDAFPVDVWVMKALKELYFPRRRPTAAHLQRFTETYFGCNAGYAQQYLFHYMRTQRSAVRDKPLALAAV